ncbi:MAG TPA: Fic family protein [Acholeplasmataceae bacterium]|nr:Fic family protein [Acholeplasmataceae bacterium]HQC30371.1 Fic family protein [Acholeplasmataceae bacterium]
MHKLPIIFNYDDPDILRALIDAKYELGNLNGFINVLPNPKIILNAVILGEAKESSSIENIVTTFDEIFKEITLKNQNYNTKEVVNYREALLKGYFGIKEKGYLSTNMIVDIHSVIDPNVGGIRKIPGTVILNTKTKEVLHIPPQSESEIMEYMSNLEKYINYSEFHNIDPILKMAMIHYQFESIHPFHDGNGRTGRVLNMLYLILEKQISLPILYLSKYINKTRDEYYKHLHDVRIDDKNIKSYLIYMINGVEETSIFTINFIKNFISSMDDAAKKIKELCPEIYSEKLVTYLFFDFYTKNEYFRENLNVSRNTASKYLNLLVEKGILVVEQVGKQKVYKNTYLYNLIKNW